MFMVPPGTAVNFMVPHDTNSNSLILLISRCTMSKTSPSSQSFILTEVSPAYLSQNWAMIALAN